MELWQSALFLGVMLFSAYMAGFWYYRHCWKFRKSVNHIISSGLGLMVGFVCLTILGVWWPAVYQLPLVWIMALLLAAIAAIKAASWHAKGNLNARWKLFNHIF